MLGTAYTSCCWLARLERGNNRNVVNERAKIKQKAHQGLADCSTIGVGCTRPRHNCPAVTALCNDARPAQLLPQNVYFSTCSSELLPQQHDLCGGWVAVNNGLVLDVPGAVGVAQRIDGLLHVGVGGRHARHHHSAGVVAERVLQQARELAVSVRYMLVAIDESLDYIC